MFLRLSVIFSINKLRQVHVENDYMQHSPFSAS